MVPFMNTDLPPAINQWHVEYDPFGFTKSSGWLTSAEKTEDILQLAHIYGDGPIVDVGFYSGLFKVLVIRNNDWDDPHESFASASTKEITTWLYTALDRYANGF
jgi:hypothetical protein